MTDEIKLEMCTHCGKVTNKFLIGEDENVYCEKCAEELDERLLADWKSSQEI